MSEKETQHKFTLTMQEALAIVSKHVVEERLPLGSYDVSTNHVITTCGDRATVTAIDIIATEAT